MSPFSMARASVSCSDAPLSHPNTMSRVVSQRLTTLRPGLAFLEERIHRVGGDAEHLGRGLDIKDFGASAREEGGG